MDQIKANPKDNSFGSEVLDRIVSRLKSTSEPKRRYEYVLWLAKKLPELSTELRNNSTKVKGCISEVYVYGKLLNGKIIWDGYSDALITKGLLALLIEGLNNLTPQEVLSIDEGFIKETGLQTTLTPSRANGFLNIFLKMRAEAKKLS